MRRLIRSSLVLAATLAIGVTLSAQAKPNFSGEWTMVPEKSDFGPLAKPTKMTRAITHADPALTIVTTQSGGALGDTSVTTIFSTDGKPQKNTVSGNPMTTVGKWDGSAIVLNSTLPEVTIEDRYSLSDEGKTLTVVRKFTTSEGAATATIVLTKK